MKERAEEWRVGDTGYNTIHQELVRVKDTSSRRYVTTENTTGETRILIPAHKELVELDS